MHTTDHTFDVPLDHADPTGRRIELYAREVTVNPDLPWLLFLGGGPGFPAPRPTGGEGWLRRALRDHRVLLLDQRGTGRSTPVTRHSPTRDDEYLSHFRADSIVRDAEAIRVALGSGPWSVLGQSFGGFCATTYLSLAPDGLRQVYLTGGLPSVERGADDVYRALYSTVDQRIADHFQRFPDDSQQVARIIDHVDGNDVRLPTGRRLTVEAFQTIGTMLGGATGSTELHHILESPFDGPHLSDAFLIRVDAELSWARANPLYSVLHEATYGAGRTRWSAHRIRAERPAAPFTGEMIYPWQFDWDPLLTPFRDVAHELAEKDWPALHDPERLRGNQVPVAAAVYQDDMYVHSGLSLESADLIAGIRVWHTDAWGHDGLRVSDGAVLDHLFSLAGTP